MYFRVYRTPTGTVGVTLVTLVPVVARAQNSRLGPGAVLVLVVPSITLGAVSKALQFATFRGPQAICLGP